jgi:hypothetical protein
MRMVIVFYWLYETRYRLYFLLSGRRSQSEAAGLSVYLVLLPWVVNLRARIVAAIVQQVDRINIVIMGKGIL